jgi:hypothetical protein
MLKLASNEREEYHSNFGRYFGGLSSIKENESHKSFDDIIKWSQL